MNIMWSWKLKLRLRKSPRISSGELIFMPHPGASTWREIQDNFHIVPSILYYHLETVKLEKKNPFWGQQLMLDFEFNAKSIKALFFQEKKHEPRINCEPCTWKQFPSSRSNFPFHSSVFFLLLALACICG